MPIQPVLDAAEVHMMKVSRSRPAPTAVATKPLAPGIAAQVKGTAPEAAFWLPDTLIGARKSCP